MELDNYEENDRLSKIRHAEFEMNHWRTKSHTNEDDTYNIFEDSFDETEECSAELEEIFEIPATG
jgi:hypothetical protein